MNFRKLSLALALTVTLPTLAHAEDTNAARPIPALRVAHPEKGVLFDIKPAGSQLIAVGAHGSILRSADGRVWAQADSPVDTALTWLTFADERNGWAVGHDAVILHTADAGASWQLQNFEPALNAPIFSIAASDARTAVAVGAFGLMKRTLDDGKTWQDSDMGAFNSSKGHMFAIARLRDGSLLTVGEAGLMGVSSDSGQSWKPLAAVYDGSLFGVQPWHEHGAVIYGLLGNIFISDDVRSGQWSKLDAGSSASLFGGVTASDGTVYLVGGNGTVVRIAADGRSASLWPHAQGQDFGALTSASFLHSELVLVGEEGFRIRGQ